MEKILDVRMSLEQHSNLTTSYDRDTIAFIQSLRICTKMPKRILRGRDSAEQFEIESAFAPSFDRNGDTTNRDISDDLNDVEYWMFPFRSIHALQYATTTKTKTDDMSLKLKPQDVGAFVKMNPIRSSEKTKMAMYDIIRTTQTIETSKKRSNDHAAKRSNALSMIRYNCSICDRVDPSSNLNHRDVSNITTRRVPLFRVWFKSFRRLDGQYPVTCQHSIRRMSQISAHYMYVLNINRDADSDTFGCYKCVQPFFRDTLYMDTIDPVKNSSSMHIHEFELSSSALPMFSNVSDNTKRAILFEAIGASTDRPEPTKMVVTRMNPIRVTFNASTNRRLQRPVEKKRKRKEEDDDDDSNESNKKFKKSDTSLNDEKRGDDNNVVSWSMLPAEIVVNLLTQHLLDALFFDGDHVRDAVWDINDPAKCEAYHCKTIHLFENDPTENDVRGEEEEENNNDSVDVANRRETKRHTAKIQNFKNHCDGKTIDRVEEFLNLVKTLSLVCRDWRTACFESKAWRYIFMASHSARNVTFIQTDPLFGSRVLRWRIMESFFRDTTTKNDDENSVRIERRNLNDVKCHTKDMNATPFRIHGLCDSHLLSNDDFLLRCDFLFHLLAWYKGTDERVIDSECLRNGIYRHLTYALAASTKECFWKSTYDITTTTIASTLDEPTISHVTREMLAAKSYARNLYNLIDEVLKKMVSTCRLPTCVETYMKNTIDHF